MDETPLFTLGRGQRCAWSKNQVRKSPRPDAQKIRDGGLAPPLGLCPYQGTTSPLDPAMPPALLGGPGERPPRSASAPIRKTKTPPAERGRRHDQLQASRRAKAAALALGVLPALVKRPQHGPGRPFRHEGAAGLGAGERPAPPPCAGRVSGETKDRTVNRHGCCMVRYKAT